MKNHLLGIAVLAAFGSLTISNQACAQQATDRSRTITNSTAETLITSSVATAVLSSDNSFQDVVTVNAERRQATHRFELNLPQGASLHPALPSDMGKSILLGEILVQDKQGELIGVIDSAWAQDASGNSLLTYFTIDGQTLVQTIDTSNAAEKSATATFTYAGSKSQSGAPVSEPGNVISKAFVGIPSSYIYRPSLGSLHDYCTSSPDSFGSANFRGPCARHDMCYQTHTAGKRNCDNWLRTDLRSNCEYAYAWYNPVRATCYSTANIYWAAVTAFGGY